MRLNTLAWVMGAAFSAFALVGCGQTASPPERSAAKASPDKPESTESGAKKYEVKVASAEDRLVRAAPAPAERNETTTSDTSDSPVVWQDAEPTEMPKVFLTEGHAKMCRVKVGDDFPALELADLRSKKQSLEKLLGKNLTVVVFWNGRQPSALAELADVQADVERRFAKDGVAVIGINSGDDPRLAAELAKHAGATFVNLTDRGGKALAQVGTGKVPRTYLLDASGKIVWFDIEYSRTTRRDLTQSIRFLLAQH